MRDDWRSALAVARVARDGIRDERLEAMPTLVLVTAVVAAGFLLAYAALPLVFAAL